MFTAAQHCAHAICKQRGRAAGALPPRARAGRAGRPQRETVTENSISIRPDNGTSDSPPAVTMASRRLDPVSRSTRDGSDRGPPATGPMKSVPLRRGTDSRAAPGNFPGGVGGPVTGAVGPAAAAPGASGACAAGGAIDAGPARGRRPPPRRPHLRRYSGLSGGPAAAMPLAAARARHAAAGEARRRAARSRPRSQRDWRIDRAARPALAAPAHCARPRTRVGPPPRPRARSAEGPRSERGPVRGPSLMRATARPLIDLSCVGT